MGSKDLVDVGQYLIQAAQRADRLLHYYGTDSA